MKISARFTECKSVRLFAEIRADDRAVGVKQFKKLVDRVAGGAAYFALFIANRPHNFDLKRANRASF